jgi:hypothetical protein
MTLAEVTVPYLPNASRKSSDVVLNDKFPTYNLLVMIIPWAQNALILTNPSTTCFGKRPASDCRQLLQVRYPAIRCPSAILFNWGRD